MSQAAKKPKKQQQQQQFYGREFFRDNFSTESF
jgi:hypothetical protein